MVHALRGLWSVLADGGTLVDLRPLSSPCPLEGVSSNTMVVPIGEIDGAGMSAEDDAADEAIACMVRQGWFGRCRETRFDFELYADGVAEMQSFHATSRRMKHVEPSWSEIEVIYGAVRAEHREGVRLRCRRPTRLVTYNKENVHLAT